ncbi:DUF4124 domain-containing protein [Stutzerimonas urumqiensis]|uniref:DUF4124 domain-containing protein n=1 Tax=Stutzerimonas urumqiensis TaxID=638269 RepID=UPI003BAA74E4
MRRSASQAAGLLLLFTGYSGSVAAEMVYRCVSPGGAITFTQQGCPSGQQGERRKAYSPTPGSGKPTPMARIDHDEESTSTDAPDELVVIGTSDDGCGNILSRRERRQAIIRKQVRPGLSQDDIESMLGKPDTTTLNNGAARYRYEDERGRSRSVSFDQYGCVKGKRK